MRNHFGRPAGDPLTGVAATTSEPRARSAASERRAAQPRRRPSACSVWSPGFPAPGYRVRMRIEQVTAPEELRLGADLFDQPIQAAASARFLERAGHHLLFAYDDDRGVIGMISGVETTHPDKGTEMFLYELGVAPPARRKGVAAALVRALAAVAQERGCYAMWVAVDAGNDAALATYRRAGVNEEAVCVTLSWELNPSGTTP